LGQLDGRVAIVTGGAKSIGDTFCRALAAEGASIVVFDIVDGASTADGIAKDFGVPTFAMTGDVSREDDVVAAVTTTIGQFGRIDILVNNAAHFASSPIVPHTELAVDDWDKIMAVNLRGPFLMVKHVTPHMSAAGYGKIVNIGSATANKGIPNLLAYVSSKAAMLGFTRTLSREVGASGICVNTLSPGLIESESLLENPQHLAAQDRVIATRALQRVSVPEDIAGALVFLASPASDFMTGQTIVVDGGSVNT
jgi:NAD(P)-dependent dehydrogenase (short-subunit alcohol dehydrogenase family)